mmetsp:Transcript_8015/g.12127  ORF Transcript_8015/g.12127 Transcript_8015/m.12127 type:complete len:136 (-) Transcript_8015:24-431(-)
MKNKHTVTSWPPFVPPPKKNEVFISRKSNDVILYKKIMKLLGTNDEVVIHGLGAAIEKAVTIALKIEKRNNGAFSLKISTSSVELTDEIFEKNEKEIKIENRINSAIHIVITHAQGGRIKVTTTKKQAGRMKHKF